MDILISADFCTGAEMSQCTSGGDGGVASPLDVTVTQRI